MTRQEEILLGTIAYDEIVDFLIKRAGDMSLALSIARHMETIDDKRDERTARYHKRSAEIFRQAADLAASDIDDDPVYGTKKEVPKCDDNCTMWHPLSAICAVCHENFECHNGHLCRPTTQRGSF